MRKALEEARAEAILDPTPGERVAAYLRLQQETLQRAAAFSDAFRRTVWATPDLDYTLTSARWARSPSRSGRTIAARPATPRSPGSGSATD